MVMEKRDSRTRTLISIAFTRVQDVVYIALGVLLAVCAVGVLVYGGIDLARAVLRGIDVHAIVQLLDRILLSLMIVELLYTVQVSFREHTLVPEPFVLVALIAAVRRILVITAEFGAQSRTDDQLLHQLTWELGLLTLLIVVLVGSLVVLQRKSNPAGEGRREP